MNKKNMVSITGNNFDCEIIRYFEAENNQYLLYSLNEIDEVGYVKLYASKILENSAISIEDEQEWSFVKEVIKEIVRNNRDGVDPEINDLDESNLDNVLVEDSRVFKLQGNLVNLLMENKKVASNFVSESFEEEIDNDVLMVDNEEIEEPSEVNYSLESEEVNEEIPEVEEYEEPQVDELEEVTYNSFESEELEYDEESNELEQEDIKESNLVDYEVLYNEAMFKNELLESRVSALERELETYKSKIQIINDTIHS